MSKYLLNTVETYRVNSEEEAKRLIEETKENTIGTMTKYSTTYKNAKAKGEIVDEWYRVTLTQVFNDEKNPDGTVDVEYSYHEGVFPFVKEDEE